MQKGSATLFLLITVLVAVIGFFAFRQWKLPSAALQSPGVIASPLPNSPSYINQELGFEFKYPEDLTIKEDSEEEFNKRGNGDFRKNFKGYVGYEPGKALQAVVVLDKDENYDKSPLSVWIFNNDNNLTIEQWFKDYWYYPFLWGVFDYTSKGHIALDQEATISGQQARYKIISYQPGSPKFLYVSKDGKMYLFRIIGETGEKILSDFKFLQ